MAEEEKKRREEQNTASPKFNAPGPSHKEDTPMPALEEKQKVKKLDLSKLRNPSIREIIASIMVTADTPSPAKTCKRWGPPCLFYTQSVLHPSPVDSYWLEEDWDGNIEKEKRKKKQRKEEEMKQEVEVQEKQNFNPNYYLPSLIYVPSYEEGTPCPGEKSGTRPGLREDHKHKTK